MNDKNSKSNKVKKDDLKSTNSKKTAEKEKEKEKDNKSIKSKEKETKNEVKDKKTNEKEVNLNQSTSKIQMNTTNAKEEGNKENEKEKKPSEKEKYTSPSPNNHIKAKAKMSINQNYVNILKATAPKNIQNIITPKSPLLKNREEDNPKMSLEEKAEKFKQKCNLIDGKVIFKLTVNIIYNEDKDISKSITSQSNEVFYFFKKRLFEEMQINEKDHIVYLVNQNITRHNLKMMSEIFQNDKAPLIRVTKKFELDNSFKPQLYTKVSVENFPTINEIFSFLNAFLDRKKYPKNYLEDIMQNKIIFSFKEPEIAYSFLMALNNEKFSNNLFSKIKTSLFSESGFKSQRKKQGVLDKNYNLSHHSKEKNTYIGYSHKSKLDITNKHNVSQGLVFYLIFHYFITVS